MFIKIEKLNKLALERGQSLAQMALAWVLRKPQITSVLIGARNVEQLEDSLKCLDHTEFTSAELDKIEGLLK